jgi:hypothetical protein
MRKHDAHRLGVPRAAAGDLLVARLGRLAADVADVDVDHAIGHLHPVLDAPEAAGREDRDLARPVLGRGLLRRTGIGLAGRTGREGGEGEERGGEAAGHDEHTTHSLPGYLPIGSSR